MRRGDASRKVVEQVLRAAPAAAPSPLQAAAEAAAARGRAGRRGSRPVAHAATATPRRTWERDRDLSVESAERWVGDRTRRSGACCSTRPRHARCSTSCSMRTRSCGRASRRARGAARAAAARGRRGGGALRPARGVGPDGASADGTSPLEGDDFSSLGGSDSPRNRARPARFAPRAGLPDPAAGDAGERPVPTVDAFEVCCELFGFAEQPPTRARGGAHPLRSARREGELGSARTERRRGRGDRGRRGRLSRAIRWPLAVRGRSARIIAAARRRAAAVSGDGEAEYDDAAETSALAASALAAADAGSPYKAKAHGGAAARAPRGPRGARRARRPCVPRPPRPPPPPPTPPPA